MEILGFVITAFLIIMILKVTVERIERKIDESKNDLNEEIVKLKQKIEKLENNRN